MKSQFEKSEKKPVLKWEEQGGNYKFLSSQQAHRTFVNLNFKVDIFKRVPIQRGVIFQFEPYLSTDHTSLFQVQCNENLH